MSTTADILTSVKKKDFVRSGEHFTKVIEAKMRKALAREFKEAGQEFFSPAKK